LHACDVLGVREPRAEVLHLEVGAQAPHLTGGPPGFVGVSELRQRGVTTPVYIVTAFHKEFLAQLNELSRSGVEFEILSKPVGAQTLLEVATTVLEGELIHTLN